MHSGPGVCTPSRCRPTSRPRRAAPTRGSGARRSAGHWRAAPAAPGDGARIGGEALGVASREIPSEPLVGAYHEALGGLEGLAAENLQARIRGTMLMALSNAHGWLVLATGNKSELSVGYSTLYGDLAGGFALIKDIYKTHVFRLALPLNERGGRAPSPAPRTER